METKSHLQSEPIAQLDSLFETTVPGTLPELVDLLKLSEREGAFGKLSKGRQEVMLMRVVEGLTMPQIAHKMKLTKQNIHQQLKSIPASLQRQMLKDINDGRTDVGYKEIIGTYRAYIEKVEPVRRGKI